MPTSRSYTPGGASAATVSYTFASSLSSLVVAADRAQLEHWVGGGISGVHVVPPRAAGTGVVEVVVQTAHGPAVLHPSSLG